MFLDRRSFRGHRPHSPEYEKELRQLRDSLINSGLTEGCLAEGKKKSLLSISLVFYFKENIGLRDLDNVVKAVVDALSAYFGFNDNRIISYKACKRMITDFPDNGTKCEWVYFKIEKSSRKFQDLKIPYEDFSEFLKQEGS